MGVTPVRMCTKNTSLVFLSDMHIDENSVWFIIPFLVLRYFSLEGWSFFWFHIKHNNHLYAISLYRLYVSVVLRHVWGEFGRYYDFFSNFLTMKKEKPRELRSLQRNHRASNLNISSGSQFQKHLFSDYWNPSTMCHNCNETETYKTMGCIDCGWSQRPLLYSRMLCFNF